MSITAAAYTEFANRIGRGVGDFGGAPGRLQGQIVYTTDGAATNDTVAEMIALGALPANAVLTALEIGPNTLPRDDAGAAAAYPVLDGVNQVIRYVDSIDGSLLPLGDQTGVATVTVNVEWCIP